MTLRISPADIVRQSKSPLLAAHFNWARVALGDIAEVKNGFAFKSQLFNKREGTPLLRIRDVGRDSPETYYSGQYDPTYIVRTGEIVVGMDGDFRVARWRGPEALLNQRVCKVIVRDQSFYDEDFLLYVLPGYLDAIHDFTSSVTVTHLSSESVKEIPLPLPPLAEQRRIVAAIEELFPRIDAGVESLQRARRNLQRMWAAVLQAAVTGRLVPRDLDAEPAERVLARALELHGRSGRRGRSEPLAPDLWPHPVPNSWCLASLGMLTTDGRYGSSTKCSHDGRGLPVLRIPNIRDGRVVRDDLKFAVDTSLDLSTSRVSSGDLLFVRTNGSRDLIGRAAVVGGDSEGMAFASYLIRMRPLTELVTPRYLVFAASAPSLRAEIQTRAATSAGQYNLSLATLRGLPISLPPLSEQRRIVQEIERRYSIFDTLDRAMATAFGRARHLRRSVLAEAFDGSLASQDSSDEPATLLLNRIARAAEDFKFRNSRKGSRR